MARGWLGALSSSRDAGKGRTNEGSKMTRKTEAETGLGAGGEDLPVTIPRMCVLYCSIMIGCVSTPCIILDFSSWKMPEEGLQMTFLKGVIEITNLIRSRFCLLTKHMNGIILTGPGQHKLCSTV